MKVKMILFIGNLIEEEHKRKKHALEAAIKEEEDAVENSEHKEKMRKLVKEACKELEDFEYRASEFLEAEMN